MKIKWYVFVLLMVATVFLSSFFTLIIADSNDVIVSTVTNNNQQIMVDDKLLEDKLNIKKITDTYNYIKKEYVNDTKSQDLTDGAIEGMLKTLKDKHSVYMDAEVSKEFQTTLDESFQGIGAVITLNDGYVTISEPPIKGAPSNKAGLRMNDQIIKVDGKSLEGLSLLESVSLIRGPKGTEVVLTIKREGNDEPIEIMVIRDEIPIITVHSKTISTENGLVGKIEINNFGESTADEFIKALNKLEKQGIKGLIIDVRGNPGGYLHSVLEIGNKVIANGGTILHIEEKDGTVKPYKSSMRKAKYPIVCLIDEGSASASEILASALQEACGYKIIGDTSYGKGTVQKVYDLEDGSNIKLTIAKWLTPKRNWINDKGVEPDIQVSQPDYYYSRVFSKDTTLKVDMNNSQVKNLQIMLKGLGYDSKREDGYFSKDTEIAVKSFQKANGLVDNGIVDSKTIKKLETEISNKIKDPSSDAQLKVAIETIKNLIK